MSVFSNRVNDAYKAAASIERLIKERDTLTKIINAAEKTLTEMQSGQTPTPENLMLLDLGGSTGYALKLKLRGILKVKRNQIHQIKLNLKQEQSILQTISVCPVCGGSGEFTDHNYERFSRQIHATTSTSICENCDGSGHITLGEEVEKIIRDSKKLEY